MITVISMKWCLQTSAGKETAKQSHCLQNWNQILKELEEFKKLNIQRTTF